jgi:hypothetical protein
MFKVISNFIKRCARSRLGQLLFLIHLILIVYAVSDWHSHPSEFDSSYSSILFNFIKILDTPILYPLTLIARNILYPTKLNEAIVGGIASLQWWLIGHLIESFLQRQRERATRRTDI